MLDTKQIDEIAISVANATLGAANVVTVSSQPMVDWMGDDALEIFVILAPNAQPSISGDAVNQTLSKIHHRLQEAGEDRFPFMRYATENELKELEEAED